MGSLGDEFKILWLIGRRYVNQCNLGVWECGILCSLIRCYLVNGFGEMLPKSSPFGEQWFTPSMVLIGEIGCPRRLKNLMV